ncbi:unnamed protein product [Leptidea sinapis]|uniref:Centrosomal protein 43 n=1 Tax=Leptidea sinapis TaxID=189913 RepID=A0A5E4QJT2_9NEOP|nr:unnamed protein product [Leptidea sinapis]
MNENKAVSDKELLEAIKNLLKKSDLDKNTIPEPTEEVLLINELVREYLEWNGYLYTASVMVTETAMPSKSKTRGELCAEVGVKDDEKSSALPLLSNIVAAYTERIKRKLNKVRKDDQ